jgi:hypothetical protein
MAYILGIITTDGCLVEHKNGFHGLDITSKDRELLDRIKLIMHAEHKIGKKTRGYRLQIRNRILYNDLLRLGLTPRKTKTKIFPNIPKQYLADFVRGCFDGDGSVFIWKEPRWNHTWQIRTVFSSGSIEFIRQLRQILYENVGLGKGYLELGRKVIQVKYAIADSLTLYRFMYSIDCDLYLKRKKEIFEAFFNFR